MKLIHKEAWRAGWTGIEFDERVGMGALAAVEAERKHDPDRGMLSTLVVTSIRNAYKGEVAKHRTRMKYDGIQASILLPNQIPAADTPDPERQAIFRDSLEKLPEDGRHLVNLALHTPKGVRLQKDKNVLKALQDHLQQVEGWAPWRIAAATAAVRGAL